MAVEIGSDAILVIARSVSADSPCPCCGGLSRRVHSCYVRRVADLPCAGRGIRLHLIAHRLRCADGGCRQQIFAERFGAGVLAKRARRTARLDGIVHHVIGVDDWAFRRNHRYGSIICDLERRRTVALLPDREVATVQARLADHTGIKVVSRDRGGGYGEAAAKALPHAIQSLGLGLGLPRFGGHR